MRPYPYHLDYYRMKYGGSYAPYFGNLYGTPNVYVAPQFFGTVPHADNPVGFHSEAVPPASAETHLDDATQAEGPPPVYQRTLTPSAAGS